jgi:hypothetical protein
VKVYTQELRDLYSSQSVTRMIKSQSMRWPGRITGTGWWEESNAYELLVAMPEGRRTIKNKLRGLIVRERTH